MSCALVLLLAVLFPAPLPSTAAQVLPQATGDTAAPVDTEALLREMADLERLARLPEVGYRNLQYSSYDRRSKRPDEDSWFSNADGFGREPVPGFEAVLREPGEDGVGEYLLCDVAGPGAIVRGWSAGMGGTLRVSLDGAVEPVFEGSGYDFLARRSAIWFDRQGLDLTVGDAFQQQDADYFPVPFAERLRVTWTGPLNELHFYHLQVRLYDAGVAVRSFHEDQLPPLAPVLTEVAGRLTRPRAARAGRVLEHQAELAAGDVLRRDLAAGADGAGAVTELALRLRADDLAAALRGVLLRLNFDGAEAEVVAPVGDFFGSFPGHHPHQTLAFTATPDGWLYCHFPMPFAASAALELDNRSGQALAVELRHTVAPWTWDERSLHFRADWRQGPAVTLVDGQAVDLDFLRAEGAGRLVGVASLLLNPSRLPLPWGNWWGEGDEKVFVDSMDFPVLFGTGSEDYYNYSWSRPDLFEHPYCAQPVDSGPGTAGYVVNSRLHVLDDLLFRRFVDFRMELWPHRQDFPTSYARVAWWYARPGARADTPPIAADDLLVPALPRWEPDAAFGSADSWSEHLEDLETVPPGAALDDEPLASRGRVLAWTARAGERMTVPFAVDVAGRYRMNLVARNRQDGGAVRLWIDGEPLDLTDAGGGEAATGAERVTLVTRHAVTRMLSLGWEEVALEAGSHVMEVECLEEGAIAFDYLWLKTLERQPARIEGAVEAETAPVSGDAAEGWEVQGMPHGWSGGRHLWVRATAPGQGVELEIPVATPGRYRVQVRLTKSWDYGVLELRLNGEPVVDGVDTWAPSIQQLPPVDLGAHELDGDLRLGVVVTGSNPESRSPHHYFGVDCVVLTPEPGGASSG